MHGHSHDGSGNHSHGEGGASSSSTSTGFGNNDTQSQSQSQQQQGVGGGLPRGPAGMMPGMPMGGLAGAGGMMPPMMMNPADMTPQMMEFAKRMQEQRQLLMKDYTDKGGQSNPEALQELMVKAAKFQKEAVAQMKREQQGESAAEDGEQPANSSYLDLPGSNTSLSTAHINYPRQEKAGFGESSEISRAQNATSLLGNPINNSDLDQLIEKASNKQRNQHIQQGPNSPDDNKTNEKKEEEARILAAIAGKDYEKLNAVKSAQYGVIDRLKELIESGETNPNEPDAENVYLLHWAAINNRLDVADYLLNIGCEIDQTGGELQSTPLNWAARSGHVAMVILLMKRGANPRLYDVEGFSTIHLASMFSHSHVVAYLLVNGVEPDMLDKNGCTALMYAAQRCHSRDPAQLLITFSSRLNIQDPKGNTALHYCVAYNNGAVMKVLLSKGASLDVRNAKQQTALQFAVERKKMNAYSMMSSYTDVDKEKVPTAFFRSLAMNKNIRKRMTQLYPFLLLYYVGMLLETEAWWAFKLFAFGFLYFISYSFKTLFFDKNVGKYVPIATAIAFIFWLYVTWIVYFEPLVFRDASGQHFGYNLYSLAFVTVTFLSWYCFRKSVITNPGILKTDQNQMNKTILKLVESNEFTTDQFCSACIIRKPLRSKHCAECDHCVAKFDHHCPWVDNCVGQNNLKYFTGFLFFTPLCIVFYLHGAYMFYMKTCHAEDLLLANQMSNFETGLAALTCSPWVGMFNLVAVFNMFWISMLCCCHLYQAIGLGLTTNERLNLHKYKHFRDEDGHFKNPFNFGVFQNFVDLVELPMFCMRPSNINWKKGHDIQDLLASRRDKKKENPEHIV